MARRRSDDSSERYQDDLLEMEREFEERIESKRRRGVPRDYQDSPKRDRKKTKAPLLLRVLAWCGVILFCFVVGYVGTGRMVKMLNLDKQSLQKQSPPPNQSSNSGDAPPLPSGGNIPEPGAMNSDIQRSTFSVFYPKDGELIRDNVNVMTRTLEDNIQETVLSVLKLSGMFGDAVNVLHVFRDVDTVYLDLSSHFLDSLNAAGENAGSLLITCIARTMNDNFSLNKVRFLVESKVVSSGPLDLSAVWQLQN